MRDPVLWVARGFIPLLGSQPPLPFSFLYPFSLIGGDCSWGCGLLITYLPPWDLSPIFSYQGGSYRWIPVILEGKRLLLSGQPARSSLFSYLLVAYHVLSWPTCLPYLLFKNNGSWISCSAKTEARSAGFCQFRTQEGGPLLAIRGARGPLSFWHC